MLRTGWDEQQLASASRHTVDSLSWVLFGEMLRDDLGAKLDLVAHDIDEAAFELSHPSKEARERRVATRLAEGRLALGKARLHADATRLVLWPVDDDEPVTTDG